MEIPSDLIRHDYAVEPPDFGRLRESVTRLKSRAGWRDHIFFAPMPKSGSTFLSMVARELTGYDWFPMNFAYWQLEHDMYLPALLRALDCNTVTQQHVKASDSNVELMEIFGIRPVVLVRNLFDVAVSYRDHLHKYRVRVPPAFLNERFFELGETEQLDLIVDMFMPWYISFYASWYDVKLADRLDHLWLRYEEMVADTITTVRRVFEFYNIPAAEAEIRAAIECLPKWKIGFNKGVTGRGADCLTDDQCRRIVRLTRHYPWVDFGMVGIEGTGAAAAPAGAFHAGRSDGLDAQIGGDFERAKAAYAGALSRRPDHGPVLTGLGDVFRAEGDPRSALRTYMEAIRYDPAAANVWERVARMAMERGDRASAREACENALRLNPGNRRIDALLAEIRGGAPAAAIDSPADHSS